MSAEWEAVLEQVQGCGSIRFVKGGLLCWGGLGELRGDPHSSGSVEKAMGVAGPQSLFR